MTRSGIADLEAACLAAKALLEPTDDRTEMAWQLLDEAYHERKLFTGTVTDPIADAVAKENEACAKIADDYDATLAVASAIRARIAKQGE